MYWVKKNLPKIVISPSFALLAWFVYGFILWTAYISFTKSKILPKYDLWGVGQYLDYGAWIDGTRLFLTCLFTQYYF